MTVLVCRRRCGCKLWGQIRWLVCVERKHCVNVVSMVTVVVHGCHGSDGGDGNGDEGGLPHTT